MNPAELTVLEMLERHVKQRPDKTALITDPEKRISFSELWELSGRIYAWLKDRGIGAEDVVLYCLPRSAELCACLIGTMRAGAAFVLAETDNSPKRTEFIRRDCHCRIFVDERRMEEIRKTIPMEGYEPVHLHRLCYIAYTSGTTGDPKGVLHEYGTMENAWKSARIHGIPLVKEEDTFLLMSPMSFVFLPIVCAFSFCCGNTVAIMPYKYAKDPLSFERYQREAGITCGYLTPSFLRAHPSWRCTWRMCILSSEPADGLCLPGVTCFNCYASAEAGCLLAVYEIKEPLSPCPCGTSQSDLELFLLREDGSDAENDEPGEICFRNPYMRGYLNLPENTRNLLRGRIIHTKDEGLIDSAGRLFVRGRLDPVFKINGYRIEPEEIAVAIRQVSDLQNFAVRAFVFRDLSSIIVFYTDPCKVDSSEMRTKLRELLPEYMIPTAYVSLPDFPLLETGKLDRMRLIPPEGSWDSFRTLNESDFRLIRKGRTASVYELSQDRILKLFLPSIPFTLISQEMRLAHAAHELNIPCPDAYEIVRYRNGYGIVMDRLPGTSLEEAIKTHPETRSEMIDRFTASVRAIHQIPAAKEPFPNLRNLCISLSEELAPSFCTKEEAEKIRSVFEIIPDQNTFLHGDCHPANVMIAGKELRFIDFTLSGYGHPVFDHLCLYSHLVFLPSFLTEAQCRESLGMTEKEAEALFDQYLRTYYSHLEEDRFQTLRQMVIGIHAARLTHASIVLPGIFRDDILQKAKERALCFHDFLRKRTPGKDIMIV